MTTMIVARTKREASDVRKALGLRWRDTYCIGTARSGDAIDGCYPERIILVHGWSSGRDIPRVVASIAGIVSKRPDGAVSVRQVVGLDPSPDAIRVKVTTGRIAS